MRSFFYFSQKPALTRRFALSFIFLRSFLYFSHYFLRSFFYFSQKPALTRRFALSFIFCALSFIFRKSRHLRPHNRHLRPQNRFSRPSKRHLCGRTKGAEESSCGETVVQKRGFGESVLLCPLIRFAPTTSENLRGGGERRDGLSKDTLLDNRFSAQRLLRSFGAPPPA